MLRVEVVTQCERQARHKRDMVRLGQPCAAALALPVDPAVGLTWSHIERLRAWAEEQR